MRLAKGSVRRRDLGVGDKLGESERKGRIEAIGGSSRRDWNKGFINAFGKRRLSKKRDVGVGDKLGVSERKGRIEAIGVASATGIRDLLPLLRVKKQKPARGKKHQVVSHVEMQLPYF
ncbi:hypothetical protein CEXT_677001 [Caerostris extrusa]|uniref:Uncharacterized protein n=1 Tax=Caerostris extrusa TaxID=172846 RepID=A0AAV4Q0L6_CAEEX|nr:hypothetical protein CEXT_677001 [Caerostris extrusa]